MGCGIRCRFVPFLPHPLATQSNCNSWIFCSDTLHMSMGCALNNFTIHISLYKLFFFKRTHSSIFSIALFWLKYLHERYYLMRPLFQKWNVFSRCYASRIAWFIFLKLGIWFKKNRISKLINNLKKLNSKYNIETIVPCGRVVETPTVSLCVIWDDKKRVPMAARLRCETSPGSCETFTV